MLWRYPNRTALEPGVRLLPEVLKKAGYQTCHIGKWHVTENPLQNGMDINIAGNHIGHPKSYFSPYGMEIWKNGPEGEFLMIGYFFRVGCFWHKNFLILCYSWWVIWEKWIPFCLFLTDKGGNLVRCALNDWYRTPNVERMARQGIYWNHFTNNCLLKYVKTVFLCHCITDFFFIDWYSTCFVSDICPFSLSLRYHYPITGNLDGKQKLRLYTSV